jgi:hypothetical protein
MSTSLRDLIVRRTSDAARAKAEADALAARADAATAITPADEAAYQREMAKLRAELRRRPCSLCVRGDGCDGPC